MGTRCARAGRTHRIQYARDRGALGIKAIRASIVEHLHNERVVAAYKDGRTCWQLYLAFELLERRPGVGIGLEGLAVERGAAGGLNEVVRREVQIEGGDLRRSHLEAAAQYA